MCCLTVQLRKRRDEVLDIFKQFCPDAGKTRHFGFWREIEKIIQMNSNATIGTKVFALKIVLDTPHKKIGESKKFDNLLLLWLAVSYTLIASKNALDICFEQIFCQKHNFADSTLEKTSFEKSSQKTKFIFIQTYKLCCNYAYWKLNSRKIMSNIQSLNFLIILIIFTTIRLRLTKKVEKSNSKSKNRKIRWKWVLIQTSQNAKTIRRHCWRLHWSWYFVE